MTAPIRDICFLDVETTGLDPDRHEIIEIGAVRVTGDLRTELGHASIMVLPEHPLTADPEALRINGRGAPWHGVSLAVALGELRQLLDGAYLAGHNVWFDASFLDAAWSSAGLVPTPRKYLLDTASLAWPLLIRGLVPDLRLATICQHLGISNAGAHTALADARRALAVAEAMVEITGLESRCWIDEVSR